MSFRHLMRGVASCFDIFGVLGPQTVDEHMTDVDAQLAAIEHRVDTKVVNVNQGPDENLYYATCSCVWRGPWRTDINDANRDAGKHLLTGDRNMWSAPYRTKLERSRQ